MTAALIDSTARPRVQPGDYTLTAGTLTAAVTIR